MARFGIIGYLPSSGCFGFSSLALVRAASADLHRAPVVKLSRNSWSRNSKLVRFKVHSAAGARSSGILTVRSDVWSRSPEVLSVALEATLRGIMPDESQRTRGGNRLLAGRK
jgi:hypothetical protein